MTDTNTIQISSIVLDPSLQMRDGPVDDTFIFTLADAVRDGQELRAIKVFADEAGRHYIGDGWHRLAAYRIAKGEKSRIPAEIAPGGRAAALHYALGANADQQAKPRTRKDLRKAVITAIETYMLGADAVKNIESIFQGQKKPATQVQIAEMCKTTQNTVSLILKAIKEQETKPAAVEATTSEAAAVAVQQTFFNVLDASFRQLAERWADVVDNPRWADPSIPVKDKLAAAKDLKLNLKKMLRDIEQREAALNNTVE